MNVKRGWALILAVLAVTTIGVNVAGADPAGGDGTATPAPAVTTGTSPDGLGTWSVHYQRLNPDEWATAAVINDHIDAAANKEVERATWDGSTKRPWTFDATGTMNVQPLTVSEVFVGQYNTDEPNMPMHTLATVVCDSRSGVVITLDNLFPDKTAGLIQLSEWVESSLAATASPKELGTWRRAGQLAPIDVNFKHWIATNNGMELHFPEPQFGPGLKVVTVPWAEVAGQVAPEFKPITEWIGDSYHSDIELFRPAQRGAQTA